MTINVLLTAMLLVAPITLTPQEAAAPKSAPAATIPDTPAGTALKEFVASFNDGGEKRAAWVKTRTTVDAQGAENVLKTDAQFLQEHGPITVVRVMPNPTASTIMAVLRHQKTGAHGHLTLEVEAAAPHKVTDMQLRPATPEEIKGE